MNRWCRDRCSTARSRVSCKRYRPKPSGRHRPPSIGSNRPRAATGCPPNPAELGTGLAGAGDLFGRIARRFDLSIVAQAEPDNAAPERLIAEAALFESGRPVLIVPYIQKAGLKLDRVMVCWDGSRNAARAIADALPFLARAKAVEVVTVTGEPAKSSDIPAADIAHHLARHGLKVEVERIVAEDIDVASVILSHAADTGTDLIVMGGYGHSRVREFVLGGATRGILTAMTVPVLMSH